MQPECHCVKKLAHPELNLIQQGSTGSCLLAYWSISTVLVNTARTINNYSVPILIVLHFIYQVVEHGAYGCTLSSFFDFGIL